MATIRPTTFFIGSIIVSVLFSEQTIAYPKTDAEFARLPKYCSARMGRSSESEASYWKRRLGKGWVHIHHYCAGLNKLNTANSTYGNRQEKQDLLRKSIGDFNYMQQQAPPSFVLQPEISARKGKVLLRLGRSAEAVAEFKNAIKLNKRYTPPYAALSDYYKKIGQPAEAKKVLEQGLKYSPKSKMLRKNLDALSK